MIDTVSDRISEIIKELRLNNTSFARSIGISSTTVDGYTKGRRNNKGELVKSQPNFDVILKMVTVHNINADYILGLSESMFRNENSDIIKPLPEHVVDNWDKFMEDKYFAGNFVIKANAYLRDLKNSLSE